VPRYSNNYKTLKRVIGKALHSYDMISDGDRIAVGLSGGEDSYTLMWFLQERLARVPIHYDLFTIHIDNGFDGDSCDSIASHCKDSGYKLRIEYTDYGIVGHSAQNRENPCFLCSRLRRKRLFEIADELGCSILALGHNKDDIIETLFMNMCYAGEISTMVPLQHLFHGRFKVIRPLAYADKDTIRSFAREMDFPVSENPCPSANSSKRSEMKAFLNQLYRSNRKVKGNIFRSMKRVKSEYLLKQ